MLPPHLPALHVSPPSHSCSHAPQFLGSAESSVHVPLHLVCPPGQIQLPALQNEPFLHSVSHDPQWVLLVARSKHPPSQRVVLGGQALESLPPEP